MRKVELRPAIADDLPHIIGEPLPYRIRAFTAVADGKVIGIGGLAFPPDGQVWAFVQQGEAAKQYPVAFHRAGLMAMKMIQESGLRGILATADTDSEVAIRWLRRLGFVESPVQKINGKSTFIWNGGPT
jgi:hypothetical protein